MCATATLPTLSVSHFNSVHFQRSCRLVDLSKFTEVYSNVLLLHSVYICGRKRTSSKTINLCIVVKEVLLGYIYKFWNNKVTNFLCCNNKVCILNEKNVNYSLIGAKLIFGSTRAKFSSQSTLTTLRWSGLVFGQPGYFCIHASLALLSFRYDSFSTIYFP